MATALPTTMTIDQARAVLWTFRDFRGQPIGKLLDEGQINIRDLAFAAKNAWDQRVKLAAKTLLLNEIDEQNEPASSSPGQLNLIASERRSFAERRQMQLTTIAGMLLGVIAGLWLGWVINFLFFREESEHRSLSDMGNTSYQVMIVLVACLILIAILALFYLLGRLIEHLIFDEIERQIQLHRKGQIGEQRVLNIMYNVLDGQWWVFQNMELPGQKGDIDLVLVGPQGIYSLEIKAYGVEHRNVGDKWERRFYRQWLPAFKNPAIQARKNAVKLSRSLGNYNIKQWVEPIIIWANPEAKLTVENPATLIWQLDQISQELPNLPVKQTLTEGQRNKIVEIFKGFYKEPFTTEQA